MNITTGQSDMLYAVFPSFEIKHSFIDILELKGVAVDFPAVNGGIPICKDFLKVTLGLEKCWSFFCHQGTCTREARCRFRHVNAMEYDMEMNSYQVHTFASLFAPSS